MRVALVHYWLLGQRGGEKVIEAFCRMFPAADIFTLFYEPESVSPLIRSRNVFVSSLNPFRRIHRSLLPLMPLAVESFDLRGYDLVISSESGPAKGVITSANTRHICYCHTPMRYLWELAPEYRSRAAGPLARLMYAPCANYLRLWDYASAARVDRFVANSVNVKRRIWKTWRRRASVVYPPVPLQSFQYGASRGYYLIVSEMVSYKRLDVAVRAFAASGRKLKIVGGGPEYRALKRLAAPNIEFCGRVPDSQLRDLYSGSAALVMPGEEDFGITMVESLASGKPVIAVARGGAMEIVQNGCGLLYDDAEPDSLQKAIAAFEHVENRFHPEVLIASAARFSEERFDAEFRAVLDSRRIHSLA